MPDGFRVLLAGNIGVAQDFPTILRAAEILKYNKEIHWIIIGDGRQHEWVSKEIIKRGLQENVHLLGRHPAKTMPRYFSLADALLVTLKNEPIFSYTIPCKVQSYMACAKPIIASIGGEGMRIIRESGAGLACPPENPSSLAKAVIEMSQLSSTDRQKMGLCGRTYYEAEFERNMLIDKLEDIMVDVSGGGGR